MEFLGSKVDDTMGTAPLSAAQLAAATTVAQGTEIIAGTVSDNTSFMAVLPNTPSGRSSCSAALSMSTSPIRTIHCRSAASFRAATSFRDQQHQLHDRQEFSRSPGLACGTRPGLRPGPDGGLLSKWQKIFQSVSGGAATNVGGVCTSSILPNCDRAARRGFLSRRLPLCEARRCSRRHDVVECVEGIRQRLPQSLVESIPPWV